MASLKDFFAPSDVFRPRTIPDPRVSGSTPSFDGTPIFWEMHGPTPSAETGRPMVFCYGLVCSMNQWRTQLERYSEKHPCLLVDYRGHGQSKLPDDASHMNIGALAKDIAAALRAQNFSQPAHIWGHSMGVNVALELAVAEPTLCQSLTLIAGTVENPFRNMFGSDVLEKLTAPLFQLYQDENPLFQSAWNWFHKNPKVNRALFQVLGFNGAATNHEDVAAYAKATADVDARTFFPLIIELSKEMTKGIVPRVRTPALVIAGSKDLITPPVNQKNLSQLLPDAEFAEIPTGSHNVQLDFGEYVGLKVEEFWKRRKLR